jgi:uncharacterized membrane protein
MRYRIARRFALERELFSFLTRAGSRTLAPSSLGDTMSVFTALLIGVVAGLRAMTAPAAVSWAAYLGWIDLSQTPLAFMGYSWTPWIFSLLAVAELVNDKLPNTPSRKVPPQFAARVIMGGLAGASLGAAGGALVIGLIAGVAGAVIGTYGGAFVRGKLSGIFGRDLPAALTEDAVAVVGGFLIVWAFRPGVTAPAATTMNGLLNAWGLA